MRSTVGSVMKLPPPVPFVVRRRFWVESTRSASRTVARLTPNSRASVASLGSLCAGRISPVTISSRNWSATCSYAFRMRRTGIEVVSDALTRGSLVGAWHTEDVLSDIRLHEVVGDRRDLVEPCLAELALDVVLVREAEAPVRVEARV